MEGYTISADVTREAELRKPSNKKGGQRRERGGQATKYLPVPSAVLYTRSP